MGEIGINRRDFLYNIKFWEVRRLIRGYRNRDRLKYQLMASCAYAATYAMRDPKGMTVQDMFPSLFDTDAPDEEIPDEEVERLRNLIRKANNN